jgi:uncharacterized protein YodC (DUF2158 family)
VFRIGDLVRLKSGGTTTLTVFALGVDLQGVQRVWCCWSDEAGERRGSFSPDALELSGESSQSRGDRSET